MKQRKYCVLSDADLDLLNKVSVEHSKVFGKIQNDISADTKAGSFIVNVLDDYIYDLNDCICEDPNFQIAWYWSGSLNDYAEQILGDIKNARNSIINIYLEYLEIQDDLKDIKPDNISDVSMEYMMEIGTSVMCEEPDQEKIGSLTELEKTALNYYLVKAGFKEVKNAI